MGTFTNVKVDKKDLTKENRIGLRDLMIGDWVYAKDIGACEVLSVNGSVNTIGVSTLVEAGIGWSKMIEGTIMMSDGVFPIPLTDAILQENGWKKDEKREDTWMHYGNLMKIVKEEGMYNWCIGHINFNGDWVSEFDLEIKSVSHLQHILKSNGFGYWAENFVI
jgi:hypothetical protein